MNVAGRRWRWTEEALLELAEAFDDLLFEVGEPAVHTVASWAARGLTAYDAAYVAAEERGVELVTDDETIVALAGEITRPLLGESPSAT